MTRHVKCNFCGVMDDWGDPPFFTGGGRVDLYSENGGDDVLVTLDICMRCVGKLMEDYPGVLAECKESPDMYIPEKLRVDTTRGNQ